MKNLLILVAIVATLAFTSCSSQKEVTYHSETGWHQTNPAPGVDYSVYSGPAAPPQEQVSNNNQGSPNGLNCQPDGQQQSGGYVAPGNYGYQTVDAGYHGFGRGADLTRADFDTKPVQVNGNQFFYCYTLGGYIKGDPSPWCSKYNSYLSGTATPRFALSRQTIQLNGQSVTLLILQ